VSFQPFDPTLYQASQSLDGSIIVEAARQADVSLTDGSTCAVLRWQEPLIRSLDPRITGPRFVTVYFVPNPQRVVQ